MRLEPSRSKRNIPQCGKCQRYGHTQAYCYHSPRCVKCAGNHITKHYPRKEKSEHVKCVLCDGNHLANYKGCTVYKEIQKRTFPPLRNKPDSKPLAALPQPYIRSGTSYSAALRLHHQYETATVTTQQIPTQQQQINPPTSEILELKTMMKGLMEPMSTMLNLLTTVISKMT